MASQKLIAAVVTDYYTGVTSDSLATPFPPPPPPLIDAPPQPIAHWAHTLALFGVLLLTTTFGHARSAVAPVEDGSRIMRYGTSMLLEWLLLGSVIVGVYVRRDFLMTALCNRARSIGESLALGLAVYISGFMAIVFVGGALYFTPLFHKRNEAVIMAMLPHSPLEFLFWFGVSATAGICEELIFRGYLLRQLTAWTGRPVLSILVAALLFGSVHLYEGVGAILPLAALAVVYGFVVRYFKGDLRAVIVAHTLQDFLVGVLGLAKPFLDKYQPTH